MTNPLTIVGPSKRVATINKWKILDSLIFEADNIVETAFTLSPPTND